MKQFSENIPTELLSLLKGRGCGELPELSGALPSQLSNRICSPCHLATIQHLERLLYTVVMLTSRQKLDHFLRIAAMTEMATNYGLIMAGAA